MSFIKNSLNAKNSVNTHKIIFVWPRAGNIKKSFQISFIKILSEKDIVSFSHVFLYYHILPNIPFILYETEIAESPKCFFETDSYDVKYHISWFHLFILLIALSFLLKMNTLTKNESVRASELCHLKMKHCHLTMKRRSMSIQHGFRAHFLKNG